MWRLVLALWIVLAVPAARAEQVAVQSGEHDGFTRVVLSFAAPVGWQMSRTEAGYRLAVDRPGLRFDLSEVFRKVGRDRLASIWADPDSGALMIGIGCACHAFPFELRPDVLVIDLRDGPAPPGSSFELAEDGRAMPAFAARPPIRPRGRPAELAVTAMPVVRQATAGPGYDWLEALRELATGPDAPRRPPAPSSPPLAAGPVQPGPGADDGLRDALLRQIGQGAARGTITLAPDFPEARDDPRGASHGHGARQVRIGTEAGVDPGASDRPPHRLTAEGARCLPDAAVDVGSWGAATPVAETLADRTGRLYVEFDRVDPAAAATAVTYFLHLGFGAEARGLIDSLALDHPDRSLWGALARVVDGDLAPGTPLTGMEVCDGAVALWALLARPDLHPGEPVQKGAVLRAFSALPPHLRRHLGPTLAARFLGMGDTGTVRAIRDAILRPGGDPGPTVRLMAAELKGAEGDRDPSRLLALQSAPGPTAAAATIAAVRAIVAEGGTADIGLVTAIEALLREYKGAAEEPALRQALALAQASLGDFDASLGGLAPADPTRIDLWAMLAERGGDVAVLAHALPGSPAAGVVVPLPTRQRMARRLIDLGFPDAALGWLAVDAVASDDLSDTQRLLAAEAELGRRDSIAAIGLLAGTEGPEAAALRNRALLQLGTPEPLSRVQSDAAAPEEQRLQAARLARDWAAVAAEGPEVWRNAAALIAAPPATTELPPLARARALLDDSAATRAALQTLIGATADQAETGGGT